MPVFEIFLGWMFILAITAVGILFALPEPTTSMTMALEFALALATLPASVLIASGLAYAVISSIAHHFEDIFILRGPSRCRALRTRLKGQLDHRFHEADVRRIEVSISRKTTNELVLFLKAYRASGVLSQDRIYLDDEQYVFVRELVEEHLEDMLGDRIERMRKRGHLSEMMIWKKGRHHVV